MVATVAVNYESQPHSLDEYVVGKMNMRFHLNSARHTVGRRRQEVHILGVLILPVWGTICLSRHAKAIKSTCVVSIVYRPPQITDVLLDFLFQTQLLKLCFKI